MILKNIIFFFNVFVTHRLKKIFEKNTIKKNYLASISNLENVKKNTYLKYNKNYKNYKNYKIELASKKISIKKIEWTRLYDDIEDSDSLYRFNWIIKIIINQGSIDKKFQFWINNQIYNLINLTKKKKLGKFRNICFHPYNISERLTNLITYYILYKKNLSKEVYNFILSDIKILLKNLEFNGYRTGNHIINNSRALIYAGYFLENRKLIDTGVNIICEKNKKIFYEDGFLKDGSTHYHFLVTRWVFEINSLLKLLNYKNIKAKKIDNVCSKMMEMCNFFNDKSIDLFPLFGDISPDFSPKYLNHLFNNNKNVQKNFLRVWKKLKFKKNIFKKSNNIKNPNIRKHSGWLKLKVFEYVIFLRLPFINKDLSHNLIHHSHDDVGHFLIYYKKKILFSKFGRCTYNNLLGTRNIDHNKIYFINKKSKNIRLFIYSFFKNNLEYSIKKNKNYYEILFLNNNFFKWKRKILLFKSKIKIIDKNLSFFKLNVRYHLKNLRDTQIKCNFPIKYKSFLVEGYGKKSDQRMFKFLLEPQSSKNLTIKL